MTEGQILLRLAKLREVMVELGIVSVIFDMDDSSMTYSFSGTNGIFCAVGQDFQFPNEIISDNDELEVAE